MQGVLLIVYQNFNCRAIIEEYVHIPLKVQYDHSTDTVIYMKVPFWSNFLRDWHGNGETTVNVDSIEAGFMLQYLNGGNHIESTVGV